MSVMTSKQLAASIKNIRTASAKLREQIQEALVTCAYFAMKDGNTEAFNQLLDAVGSATRIKGLTAWAETFAPVVVRDGKFALNKTAKKSLDVKGEDDFTQYEVEMRKVNWWEIVEEEKAESIFDEAKYMERVIKKLITEGKTELAAAIKDAELAFRIKANAALYETEVRLVA